MIYNAKPATTKAAQKTDTSRASAARPAAPSTKRSSVSALVVVGVGVGIGAVGAAARVRAHERKRHLPRVS